MLEAGQCGRNFVAYGYACDATNRLYLNRIDLDRAASRYGWKILASFFGEQAAA